MKTFYLYTSIIFCFLFLNIPMVVSADTVSEKTVTLLEANAEDTYPFFSSSATSEVRVVEPEPMFLGRAAALVTPSEIFFVHNLPPVYLDGGEEWDKEFRGWVLSYDRNTEVFKVESPALPTLARSEEDQNVFLTIHDCYLGSQNAGGKVWSRTEGVSSTTTFDASGTFHGNVFNPDSNFIASCSNCFSTRKREYSFVPYQNNFLDYDVSTRPILIDLHARVVSEASNTVRSTSATSRCIYTDSCSINYTSSWSCVIWYDGDGGGGGGGGEPPGGGFLTSGESLR